MPLLEALAQTFDHATAIVSGVRPSQHDAPTPCHEWKVRDLLTHTLGVVINIGNGASGQPLLPDINTVELDADAGTQFGLEAKRTLAAWTARGLDGEVDIGAGLMPVPAAITINLLDTATHSWDIARATGQNGEIPDALAAFVLSANARCGQ